MSKTPDKFTARINGQTVEMRLFDVVQAEQMLPLVRVLANDVVERHCRVRHLEERLSRSHRRRRELAWPQRRARYAEMDELELGRRAVAAALQELTDLGTWVEDPVHGVIHFPTVVDWRAGFFCWRPGEDRLAHWHYSGEACEDRRPIPGEWRTGGKASQSKQLAG